MYVCMFYVQCCIEHFGNTFLFLFLLLKMCFHFCWSTFCFEGHTQTNLTNIQIGSRATHTHIQVLDISRAGHFEFCGSNIYIHIYIYVEQLTSVGFLLPFLPTGNSALFVSCCWQPWQISSCIHYIARKSGGGR